MIGLRLHAKSDDTMSQKVFSIIYVEGLACCWVELLSGDAEDCE
jgi:hypothetical protein